MGNIVTILTDFGTKDHYTGSMKGVIYGINPEAIITDITHEVPSHDIISASFLLKNFHGYFPPGTVHLVVVDPGVGSGRLPIAVSACGQYFVGPDNGVFSLIYENARELKIIAIENEAYMRSEISSTFHGRDVFAPAAAHISRGLPIDELGAPLGSPVMLDFPEPSVNGNEISGEILYTDTFGNMITNIRGSNVPPNSRIIIDGHRIEHISASYSEAAEGELLALTGSSGFLEISVNRGSARELIGKVAKSVKVIT